MHPLPRDQQHTLRHPIEIAGPGLHGGRPCRCRIGPADADQGRVFVVDGVEIPAQAGFVVDTRLATTLGRGGARVGMVEHLCAALFALGVDNARIDVEGGEVPVLDGSSRLWLEAIRSAGARAQGAARRVLAPDQAVRVEQGGGWAELVPDPAPGLHLDLGIEFDHPAIGRQRWQGPVDAATFRRELGWARTFGFLRDAELLRASGLARGASLENTVVYGDAGPINPGGLRAPDEAIRHKALDAVGDLALIGPVVHGRLRAFRAGHGLHLALAQELCRLYPGGSRATSGGSAGGAT